MGYVNNKISHGNMFHITRRIKMGMKLPVTFCDYLLFLELQFEWICDLTTMYPHRHIVPLVIMDQLGEGVRYNEGLTVYL
jgi:hypothetical protein